MKVMRVGPAGAERPAAVGSGGSVLDLSGVLGAGGDIDGPFLAGEGLVRAREAVAAENLPSLNIPDLRIGPPLAQPPKIVCIGLNYQDHAAETGQQPPEEPVVFMKAPNTVVGPYDDVFVPRGSDKTDYEVELAVVIGKEARYLDGPDAAADVIAGYAVSNDVSERTFQLERGGQWVKGKSCETFNPLGPWLVTADEVADPQSLALRLWVNGELRQDGTTKDMIFNAAHLVWYLSQFMVLEPGDVVNTGTPAGVALGRSDTPFLRAGDTVELEIEGLGRQRQTLVQA